jgi:hypothetical protein
MQAAINTRSRRKDLERSMGVNIDMSKIRIVASAAIVFCLGCKLVNTVQYLNAWKHEVV